MDNTQTQQDFVETTIYGASDDLVELSGGIDAEFDIYNNGQVGHLTLKTFDGTQLDVRVEFGPREWEITVLSDIPDGWSVEQSQRPGRESDPAIIVTHPAGTTVTCNGEDEFGNPA